MSGCYLTVILRGRAGYELIYITNEAVGRVGYYQLISGKSEKNNNFIYLFQEGNIYITIVNHDGPQNNRNNITKKRKIYIYYAKKLH